MKCFHAGYKYSALNACFSVCLNTDRFLLHLMAIGSEFHSRGPITWKDWSPKLTSFVRGTSSRCCWDEHVHPVEQCLFNMGCDSVEVRMSGSQSRESGFESSCCSFEALAILFIPHCHSCLSCINDLATDRGGYRKRIVFTQ